MSKQEDSIIVSIIVSDHPDGWVQRVCEELNLPPHLASSMLGTFFTTHGPLFLTWEGWFALADPMGTATLPEQLALLDRIDQQIKLAKQMLIAEKTQALHHIAASDKGRAAIQLLWKVLGDRWWFGSGEAMIESAILLEREMNPLANGSRWTRSLEKFKADREESQRFFMDISRGLAESMRPKKNALKTIPLAEVYPLLDLLQDIILGCAGAGMYPAQPPLADPRLVSAFDRAARAAGLPTIEAKRCKHIEEPKKS